MFDSKIKVNLSAILDIETEQHPGNTTVQDLRKILTDNLADMLAQCNDDDISGLIDSYEILRAVNREGDDEYEKEITICAHRVRYRFWGDKISEDLHSALDEEAELRAQQMITENYESGELHYEDMDIELRGCWKIVRD